MPTHCIPFDETGYFSKLICDYLAENEKVSKFYQYAPSIANYGKQVEAKQKEFTKEKRETLSQALQLQYNGINASEITMQNIEKLKENSTFTVTTGHQLNIFTGPLYFLYKIISTIKTTEKLKESYPDFHFVPVYWMATEDHDFEEISFFNLHGKKLHWNSSQKGAVGRFNTEGLEAVFQLLRQELGISDGAKYMAQLFEEAYLKHDTLTNATRYLVNELFKSYGLVIVDGDDVALKTEFIPYIKEDIFQHTAQQKVSATSDALAEVGYGQQVHPREINLFYLVDGIRERVVFEDDVFSVLETKIQFTKTEIEKEIEVHPERFSPNVIMRPLYQEVILPNLGYIGGGGEIAYWFQLQDFFKSQQVTFPILQLRNSALLITQKQADKLEKLQVSLKDCFLKRDTFINKKVRQISNIDIDFSQQKKFLQEQFEGLKELAKDTDASFIGAVKAQEHKQLKGLAHLEKRLLKAQKKKLSDHVTRITAIQNELFPNQSLQERTVNFSEFYEQYGNTLIAKLHEELDPFQKEFFNIIFEN